MENSIVKPQDPDLQLAHKHKLIYVLARALLEKLGGDDPFLDVQQAVSQASEALDVFTATITELPEVLEYILPSGITLQARGSAPLWVWLFPRVLTLLGQVNCDSLGERVQTFFSVAFESVSRSPKLWNLSSTFFVYLKECVSGTCRILFSSTQLTLKTATLNCLHDQSLVSGGHSLGVVLPCAKQDWSLFCLDEDEVSTDPASQCTYNLRGLLRCISHAKSILSILLRISTKTILSHKATPAFQDYVSWMLDSFISTSELEKRWCPVPGAQNQKSIGWSLSAVNTLLSMLRDFLSPSVLRKGYMALSVLCTDLLGYADELSDDSLQLALNGAILNLASICMQYDSVRRKICISMLPLLQNVSCGENTSLILGRDFLVG